MKTNVQNKQPVKLKMFHVHMLLNDYDPIRYVQIKTPERTGLGMCQSLFQTASWIASACVLRLRDTFLPLQQHQQTGKQT